jgi:hypothetical protein
MASGFRELARIRFTGNRSVDHALEVSALRAVIHFEVLLNEISWFIRQGTDDAAPTRKVRLQHRKIEIYLRNIEPGSTVVPLEVNADVMEWPEVRESLHLMSSVFTRPSQGEPLPEIPHSLAMKFRQLANVLNPSESMQISGAWDTSFPVTRSVSKQIKGYELKRKAMPGLPEKVTIPMRSDVETIEAILRSLAAKVPTEDWKRLPADLTDDLDHYLYGTPKK